MLIVIFIKTINNFRHKAGDLCNPWNKHTLEIF